MGIQRDSIHFLLSNTISVNASKFNDIGFYFCKNVNKKYISDTREGKLQLIVMVLTTAATFLQVKN